MSEQPEVIAFMLGEPIAPDDPYRHIKERALAVDAAATAWEDAARSAEVSAQADVIDQAAALFADSSFSLDESYEAAEAAMPGAMVSSASYIALTLREIELGAGDA